MPPAVTKEFGIELPIWIRTCNVKNREFLRAMSLQLAEGEAKTIALGMESPASVVILDDKKARKITRRLGLNITGTLGILAKAKQQGLLSSVREVVEELQRAGFRVSRPPLQKILVLAGE